MFHAILRLFSLYVFQNFENFYKFLYYVKMEFFFKVEENEKNLYRQKLYMTLRETLFPSGTLTSDDL
jgi:hypothetical protein